MSGTPTTNHQPLTPHFDADKTADVVITEGRSTSKPTGYKSLQGFRGISDLLVASQSAANATVTVAIYGVKQVQRADATTLWITRLLTTLTCTIGAATGVDGSAIENEMLIADQISAADDALLSYITGKYDLGTEVKSAADDKEAFYSIPDMGNWTGYAIGLTVDGSNPMNVWTALGS